MIWSTIALALREIRRNAMRSFLTMLGVIIGVAAVIALVTIAQGATREITDEISKLGVNLLIVSPGADRRASTVVPPAPLEVSDAAAMERELSGVRLAAPAAFAQQLAVAGNTNWRTQITGSTNAYFDVRGFDMARGRTFTTGELKGGTAACVLGDTVREELFGPLDPLGATVRVGRVSCEVVGVLSSKGESSLGSDQDDLIVMPLITFQRRVSGNRDVSAIFASAEDGRSSSVVRQQVTALMRQRRRIQPGMEDDFRVADVEEFTKTAKQVTGVLTALLGAIAAVSLLVGGIGIMNIMLVSVTERTREIGIRLAIGARGREVLFQFLIEAIVLSTIGGILGIGLGMLSSYGVTRALSIPFVVLPEVILGAFLFSGFVGVAFGFLPARKAARLDPIDALRHE